MELFADGYVPREIDFMVVEQHPTLLNVTLQPSKVSALSRDDLLVIALKFYSLYSRRSAVSHRITDLSPSCPNTGHPAKRLARISRVDSSPPSAVDLITLLARSSVNR